MQLIDTTFKIIDGYEIFCDTSYYDMWTVRKEGERTFGKQEWFDTEKEAIDYITNLTTMNLFSNIFYNKLKR